MGINVPNVVASQGLFKSSPEDGQVLQFEGEREIPETQGTTTSTNTGFKDATATGDDHNSWANPTNAFTSDNNDATETLENGKQDYYNFSFVIPDGATINGIEVNLEGANVGFGNDAVIEVELSWDGGANYTTENKQNSFGIVDEVKTYGGATDKWGRTWTASEINNTNFRLRIEKIDNETEDHVDHIEVKIYYTS